MLSETAFIIVLKYCLQRESFVLKIDPRIAVQNLDDDTGSPAAQNARITRDIRS